MSNSNSSEKKYECQICGKTFGRRAYLQLHEKIHGEKCYKCNMCNKAFSQPAGLWTHKKNQSCVKPKTPSKPGARNDSEKRHKCDVCGRSFGQKHSLNYHKRTHTGESPYPCSTCGKTFRGLANLKYHDRTHTGQKPYRCIFCVKAFTQLGTLKQHCRKEHQSAMIYECVVCKEKFEKFWKLSSHKKHHLEVENQCKSPFHRVNDYSEVECEASSNRARDLDASKSLDTKSGIDDDARVTTSGKDCLVSSHVKDSHTLDESMDIGNYETHLAASNKNISHSAHTDEGKNSLLVNGEQSTSSSLIRTLDEECVVPLYEMKMDVFQHSDDPNSEDRIETSKACISLNDDRPASTMSKLSKTKPPSEDDLTLKRQVKHEVVDFKEVPIVCGRKYTCATCNQTFSNAHVLKYHTRTHTGENPHSCPICEKAFRTPGALTVHQRTHNGEKPYKCIFCSKCFTQRGPLQQHCRRIHDSSEIYECEVCKQRFEKYKDLSFHKHVHPSASYTRPRQSRDVENTIHLNQSDGLCTMAKRAYDEITSGLKYEGETKSVEEIENFHSEAGFEDSPVSSSDVSLGGDSDKENDNKVLAELPCNIRQEEYECTDPSSSTNEQTTIPDISLSDKRLSLVHRVKQEIQQDCDFVNDCGTFPDASSWISDAQSGNLKSDSLQEISMKPIKMEGEENVPIIWNRLSQTSGNINELSLEVTETFANYVTKSEDKVSTCSRMTTPESEILVSCWPDTSQNLLSNRTSETRTCQLFSSSPNSHSEKPSDVKEQNLNEDQRKHTWSSKLSSNSNCYNREDFQFSSAVTDFPQECSRTVPIHPNVNVFCEDNTLLCSKAHRKPDGQACNPDRNLFQNQEKYSKKFSSSNNECKMFPVVGEDQLKSECICMTKKTRRTPENVQQNMENESGKLITSDAHLICYTCDVLPASSHLVSG